MKKVLILLLLIFSCTACYDYKELNNLAIVSGIAVDYDDESDKYILTFEILNDEKVSDNEQSSKKTYYVSGSGKTIIDAFNDISLEINRIPFYSHVKVMIISESIARDHANDIIDFIIRNSYITNMFYMVIAKDNDARKIIEATSTQNKIISESIYRLIDNKPLGNNLSLKVNFEEFTSLVVNPMQDLYMPTVILEDGLIKLKGISIFSNNELTDTLNFNESQTLNMLFKKSNNAYYSFNCGEDKSVTIDVYNQKIKYEVTKNKTTIKAYLMVRLEENQCGYNVKNKDAATKLSQKFNKIIKNDINDLINTLQNNNSDVLGINYMYFKEHNKSLEFKNLDFDIDVNVNINKNGLIFGVKNDNE